MEVVAAGPNSAGNATGPAGPYQHDVQEWRHLDRLTGVLHQGRREAGSWTTDQQQYGKVVDTQSLVGDGLRGLRTRQLEVFTTKSPGQQIQVVRTTSSTSTSTHWRSQQQKEPLTTSSTATGDFDDLEVSVNRLDLSSQRSRANIARSGSLSSRRPPTRTNNRPSILDRQNADGSEQTNTINDIDTWRTSFNQKTNSTDSNTGRRLNTALRNTNVDLEALDQILKSISSNSDDGKSKKNSFVTAESLQEVKGRLRKFKSDKEDINSSIDDGIVIKNEDMLSSNPGSKVRSYVYGMETMLHNKKPIIGTGSLESRTSNKSNITSNRNEDWYNRRKSYGFEQVHNQQIENTTIRKNKIESSTDSGIYRSSEIYAPEKNKKINNSTVINLNNINNNKDNELFNVWNRRSITNNKNDVEQTTITIPIVDENNTIKRHSIAVDDNKYYPRRISLALDTTKPEEIDDEDTNLNRKPKKVEFCKTEVHFAADSGRVNIVETDEKPPPTQNFRRRRRNSLTTPQDDVTKNGLPLLHFGDEKKIFSCPDDIYNTNFESTEPNVTISSIIVNNNNVNCEFDNNETESIPRGILKNKLTKPRPYILGDNNFVNNDDDNNIWGVKLRPIHKEEPQIWRSTVTVQNTSYIDPPKPEFQKLLHSLRQTNKKTDVDLNVDTDQTSSWSVADRIKQVEDKQENFKQESLRQESPKQEFSKHDLTKQECKGYSTKINFNYGEATVVENGKKEENNDKKLVLQKGLVVRIGKQDSNHTVCSKTTTNNTTTTTKITIDMSAPSEKKYVPIKLPRASLHSLKSTYLIMNTFANNKNIINKSSPEKIPDQLEALKKLYEEDSDNSLADEEVRSYMSNVEDSDLKTTEDDVSSVVSGSWSKLKAFRNIQQHLNNIKDTNKQKEKEMFKNILNRSTYKKDSLITSRYDKNTSSEAKVTSVSLRCTDKSSNSSLDSPKLSRKPFGHNKKLSYLSSPSLVGNSIQKSQKVDVVIKNKFISDKSAFSKVKNRNSLNKPDLLQFNNNNNNDNRDYENISVIKKTETPIYENIDDVITNLQQMEKESVMLQELTKAADQILQAVNGYTDEDSTKVTSSDEDKKHRLNLKKNQNLSTISETKSWKQSSQTKISTSKPRKNKNSSTSSIESLRETKPAPPVRMNRAVKLNEAKKKITNTNSDVIKQTKQRRLQRASSREALLQSHGSSSEDIAQNEVIRKPRLVRRTKTNGGNSQDEVKKIGTRRTQSERETHPAVQEIRHKTAISTIRSTAEKNAQKAREDIKKRTLVKPTVRGAASSARDVPKYVHDQCPCLCS